MVFRSCHRILILIPLMYTEACETVDVFDSSSTASATSAAPPAGVQVISQTRADLMAAESSFSNSPPKDLQGTIKENGDRHGRNGWRFVFPGGAVAGGVRWRCVGWVDRWRGSSTPPPKITPKRVHRWW